MRKFSNKEFWSIVGNHPDKERSKLIFDAFHAMESQKVSTVNELEAKIVSVIEAGVEAAVIVGCKCPNDVRYYSTQRFQIAKEILGELMLDLKNRVLKLPQYFMRTAKLGRSMARQRKCHPTERGFVCYCDEHNHPL